jgi:TonB family protein
MSMPKAASFAALACLLCTFSLRAQTKADYATLLQKAADAEDLRSPGSPPFQLNANLLFTDPYGKKVPGTYVLLWLSPDQWREEIHIDSYIRIRFGGPGKYWQQRSIDFELPHVFELTHMLDIASILRREALFPKGKLKTKTDHGVKLDCVELPGSSDLPDKEICLDDLSGTLVSEKMDPVDEHALSDLTSHEYSNFTKFGGKTLPQTIRGVAGRYSRIEYSVTEIGSPDHPSEALFIPPPNAQPWTKCEFPTDAKNALLQQPMPIYPQVSKDNHVQGNVSLYMVIGEDGVPRNLKVIAAGDRNLASASLQAVQKWRYAPKTCNGVPFAVEDFITVVFTLGG